MSKFCVKCGTRMDDNAMVCPECRMQQAGYVSPQQIQSGNDKQTGGSTEKAGVSLMIGSVGIIVWCVFVGMFGWVLETSDLDDLRLAQCIPIPGIPIAAVGLSLGIQGMKSNAKTKALAGIIVNILCLVFCVLNTLIALWFNNVIPALLLLNK